MRFPVTPICRTVALSWGNSDELCAATGGDLKVQMFDLRVLRDRWTEDGARSIFEQLVEQCVRSLYPSAKGIRPNPGDEGIDAFVGQFDEDIRVWQSKYFPDGLGKSQKAQIRSSWKSCSESDEFAKVTLWTLCLPVDLSIDEMKWWQKWSRKQSDESSCQMELWTKGNFLAFYGRPDLKPVFDIALGRTGSPTGIGEALAEMRVAQPPRQIVPLPDSGHLRDAVFVRKLEAAGIENHRAARTAFYNFELLRESIEQGGNYAETQELRDLLERVYDLWETAYNERSPDELGRDFVREINGRLEGAERQRLTSALPAQLIHKKGALYYWADLCEAGWTHDFKALGDEEASS